MIGPSYGYAFDASSTLDVSIGTPDGEPSPVRADPMREYVAAGMPEIDRGFLAIEDRFGGPLAWHGVAEYERMYNTPAAGSSIDVFRAGVLANGIGLLPAVKPRNGLASGGQRDGTKLEADMAAQVCDENRRTMDAWENPAPMLLWEMMESKYLGHTLAEVIMGDVVGGPDDGIVAVKAIRPKDKDSYQFRVDRARNVINIRAMAIDPVTGEVSWQLFDTDHFVWQTNDPYRGDPRGRSCYRKAHYFWKLLMDLWPEVWKGWKQFGVPMMYGTTAPNATMVDRLDKNGRPIPGQGTTAEFAMAMNMANMLNGSKTAGPNGSDIKILESTKDSSVVSGAVTMLQGQIIQSVLGQLRATTEAQHGSKADSETGQDVMGTLLRYERMRQERFLRSILMRQNALNYGPDIARRLTPLVDLGGTEHQDFAKNASGVGLLWQANFFSPSQRNGLDLFLGMPSRDTDEPMIGPGGVISLEPQAANAPAPAEGMAA